MKDLVPDRYAVTMRLYPYAPSPDQCAVPAARHKVVIIGGGPVGLATALDLRRRGVPVLLLDDHEGTAQGSKAIFFAKRTPEICDRLGAAAPMLAKGVQWNVGKVFHDDHLLYEFNLLPESGHGLPAFINLQQPWFDVPARRHREGAGEGRPDRDARQGPSRWGNPRRRPKPAGCGDTRWPLPVAG